MAGEVVVRDVPGVPAERSVQEMLQQMKNIQELMAKGMHKDEHYGVIPGTGNKPTLLKPGAEKLCLMFRLSPNYSQDREREPGTSHLTVWSTCTLIHIPTGSIYGTGSGMCSTHESKYAYRRGSRTCPNCSKHETIIKGRAEFGGGWLCFGKKGGCGAKFPDGDQRIESQQVDRVANDDLPDSWNTVMKMADKRALVAACLNATAASDIFTQDLEDLAGKVSEPEPEPDPDADAAKNAKVITPTDTFHAGGDSGDGEPPQATQTEKAHTGSTTEKKTPARAKSAPANDMSISPENAEFVVTEAEAVGVPGPLLARLVQQYTKNRTVEPTQMYVTEFNELKKFFDARRAKRASA